MNVALTPIHFIMYEKILFLNGFVEKYKVIAKQNDVELSRLNEFLKIEKAPLDDIIDLENVHLWIEERVNAVEGQLAYVVSEILKKDSKLMIEILKYAYRTGREENFTGNADDAFKLIFSKFFDGMPCDGAMTLVESKKDFAKFIIIKNTHEHFWKYGVDAEIYWEIRNKYIKGFLSSSRFFLYRTENMYEIREIQ